MFSSWADQLPNIFSVIGLNNSNFCETECQTYRKKDTIKLCVIVAKRVTLSDMYIEGLLQLIFKEVRIEWFHH